MFALAARRLGYRVHTFSPDTDTPTGQVADREVVAAYEDLDAVRDFARQVSVVTFEFENVPAETAEAVAALVPVRPGGEVLHIAQNRLREKTFLSQNGIPCAPFRHVTTYGGSCKRPWGNSVCLHHPQNGGLRLRRQGTGANSRHAEEAGELAWDELGGQECVLEGWVAFEREVSVVAARGVDGAFVHYGLIENAHVGGILDVSVCPPLQRCRRRLPPTR